uniref:Uncharacterized protein n=1 Tax=Photinus pyralis TaxID=7054 RepID=A0A1Y1L4E9_PHOPY
MVRIYMEKVMNNCMGYVHDILLASVDDPLNKINNSTPSSGRQHANYRSRLSTSGTTTSPSSQGTLSRVCLKSPSFAHTSTQFVNKANEIEDSTDKSSHNTYTLNRFQPADIRSTPKPSQLQDLHSIEMPIQQYKNNDIVKLLLTILEQNKQILGHLEKTNRSSTSADISLPEDFASLPCKSSEELNILENLLSEKSHFKVLIAHLSQFGGKEVIPKVNALLRKCLTNQLACKYSYLGTRLGKEAFTKLRLKEVIIGAVKTSISIDNETPVISAIKEWLKHAPQRVKLENNKIDK